MSAHHHNDNDTQVLYEGDQSKLYSGLMNHHTDIQSAESKKQVSKIWKVTGLLAIVTIIEVALGLYGTNAGMPKGLVNIFFLVLTIYKAAYIVRVFMHLGDEKKSFLITVLIPLTLFIWFIIAFLYDGGFWLEMNTNF
ncbi:MAG: cytochrome C oxidase subunit IV family protein [Bacteroidota bacterium]|jgi:cytochrome c oxidase subunit IV